MIDRRRLEDLVLARLSVSTKSPPTPSDVSKTLFRFVESHLTKAEWRNEMEGALRRLRDAGELDDDTLALTNGGRRRLCKAMGVESVAKTRNWGEFKRKHLTKLFDKAQATPNGTHPGLALVARELGVPAESAKSESSLASSWLRESLGLRVRKVTLDSVRAALIAHKLGVSVRPSLAEVVRISARTLSGANTTKADDIVRALAGTWLRETKDGKPERPAEAQASQTTDTEAAERVIEKIRRATRAPRARRFGPNKVFIASVWETLRADPDVGALGEPGFKRLLVDAHQRGALTLSRADLVSAMDPADIAASETQHLNATYHFIQISGDQP